jgi:hypothetical protein
MPAKAEILNNQFHSVYTKEDFDNLPSKGPSPHPTIPNIQVNSNGCLYNYEYLAVKDMFQYFTRYERE